MTMERYDRNSIVGLSMPTVNPCNNFIIDYLIRTKIKSDKQVSSKYYMYNLAIQSVRKYPLPLICEQQLAALQGFGNFFIKRVAKLMKRHYSRGRMPTQQQMEQDDRDHLQGIRQNLRRLNMTKKQRQQLQERQRNQYDTKKRQQESDQIQNNYSKLQNSADQFQKSSNQYPMKQDEKSKDQKSKDEKSSSKVKSDLTLKLKFEKIMKRRDPQQSLKQKQKKIQSEKQNIKQTQRKLAALKKKRNYRPRRKTQPFQILKAIVQLQNKGKKPVLKGDINQYMFNLRKQKMKGWTPVRDRLIQFGYLTADKQNQDLVTITEKGKDYIFHVEKYGQQQQNEGSRSQNQSRSKSKSPPNHSSKSKSNSKDQSEQDPSRSRSPAKSRSEQQSIASKKTSKKSKRSSVSSYSNSSYTKNKMRKIGSSSSSFRSREKVRYRPEQAIQKIELVAGKLYKQPILIYNIKSDVNIRDEDRIIQVMNKLPENVKFKQDQLTLGQFAWQVGQYLLDFLIFRVKCQSFDLDQYFLLCQRIKHSQCDNCYIIFQESFVKPKNSQTKQNLLNNVIADSRVSGFKILRTSGIEQTLSFISNMTTQLAKKVKATYTTYSFNQAQKKLLFIGSLKQFNQRTSQYKPALVRNVAVNCLRCVPNITRQMIKKILKKMPGMWYIYVKLSKLRSNSERKKFLLWYLKDCNPKKGTIRLIVDFMFFTDYND